MKLSTLVEPSGMGVIPNIWIKKSHPEFKLIIEHHEISVVPVPNMPIIRDAKCYNIFGDKKALNEIFLEYNNASILSQYNPFASFFKIIDIDDIDSRKLQNPISITMKAESYDFKKNEETIINYINNFIYDNIYSYDEYYYNIGWILLDSIKAKDTSSPESINCTITYRSFSDNDNDCQLYIKRKIIQLISTKI